MEVLLVDAALVSLATVSTWGIFLFCFVFDSAPGTSKSPLKVQCKLCRSVLLSTCVEQSRFSAFQKDTSWVIAAAIQLLLFDGKRAMTNR